MKQDPGGVMKNIILSLILSVFSHFAFSEDLILPEGMYEKLAVSEKRLGKVLADNFTNVLEVFDISFSEELYVTEAFACFLTVGFCSILPGMDMFSISFSIKTTDESVYENIKCSIHSADFSDESTILHIRDCRNKLYSFSDDKTIVIPMHYILDYPARASVVEDISIKPL